jgi:hypothetical protein
MLRDVKNFKVGGGGGVLGMLGDQSPDSDVGYGHRVEAV